MLELPNSWKKYLDLELKKPYFKKIEDFLDSEKKAWKIIYPKSENIFNALNKTPFENVKVVIIWQDPYHQSWQSHWLCFSVPKDIKVPPSLRNILKEIKADLNIKSPKHWDLTSWAQQWVLLLNAILTVEDSNPASHSKIGWQNFTDEIIKIISKEKTWVIFLLWWAFAQKKKSFIDTSKHFILETTHPSPFSVYKWFLGSKCFSKTNKILKSEWKKEIDW